jgi:hypothetical protein
VGLLLENKRIKGVRIIQLIAKKSMLFSAVFSNAAAGI